uniref:Uncharacterized protein n=1 Tax=Cacopsylla melanoneura TaxID=428564 RepID=A0A8D9BSV9_9HEMI
MEPKTEYDDNSVEDITLDDDDEDYSQAGTSQMDNSQGNFGNWQQMVGDQTGDDVFSGQDTGAQNSQDQIFLQKVRQLNQLLPKLTRPNIPPKSKTTESIASEIRQAQSRITEHYHGQC